MRYQLLREVNHCRITGNTKRHWQHHTESKPIEMLMRHRAHHATIADLFAPQCRKPGDLFIQRS